MSRTHTAIDRDKLRAAVRKLRKDALREMLEDAVECLPPSKLHQLAEKHLDLDSLRPDRNVRPMENLLRAVTAFDESSRARRYYESFAVNSKNYMRQSAGTSAWIAEFSRLLDRCVAEWKEVGPSEARAAFEILFALLDDLDDGDNEIVFFADEAGSWQVGIDWKRVLPVWFKVLAATAAPQEYAGLVKSILDSHYGPDQAPMLAAARKTAAPHQRTALDDAANRPARWRRWGRTP